jgi:hypothetical protein
MLSRGVKISQTSEFMTLTIDILFTTIQAATYTTMLVVPNFSSEWATHAGVTTANRYSQLNVLSHCIEPTAFITNAMKLLQLQRERNGLKY